MPPLPRVTLHGTSRAELINQRTNVCEKLDAALHALRLAAPHNRDFGDAAMYRRAYNVWVKRAESLHSLRTEMATEAELLAGV